MINLHEILNGISPYVLKWIHTSEARGCRVYRSTTQSVNNTTLTAMSYDIEVYSSDDACWDAGSPTHLVAPVDGYYMAGGSVEIASGQMTAAARLFIAVRANGTNYLGSNDNHTINGKAAAVGVTTGMVWLAAGEYIEIIVYHDIGSAKNISAATATSQHTNNGWLMRIS